ncbi:hypothetical protein QU816_27565 [Klebsiella pneumoniae]|nr:hypothetical protein [Klebsiella pneumoniae]MDM9230981.1 hypothetical protein [Klebsiella pneumoniae]
MPHIEELRRQRAGINEQVQALATIDASGGTLTAEQLTEFANLQQQFTDISAKLNAWKPPNVLRRWSQSQSRLPSRDQQSSSKLSRSNTQAQA